MSNRRRPTNQAVDTLSALAASPMPLPGGCPDCNAYQRVRQVSTGVFRVAVFHDDTCPYLARRTR